MRAAVIIIVVAATALASPTSAAFFVAGGGSSATDCWAGSMIGGDGSPAPRRRVLARRNVDCVDGDPGCDMDGRADGACTFDVSICVLQPGFPGCDPNAAGAITHILVRRPDSTRLAGIARLRGPHLSATTAACGKSESIVLPVRIRPRRHINRSGWLNVMKIVSTARAIDPETGEPQRDFDRLRLRCTHLKSPDTCPANPDLGPSRLDLIAPVDGAGSDLDLGWTGLMHDFPFGSGAALSFCLSGCDGGERSACTGTAPVGAWSLNGATFGAPRPLLAANLPLCLVHRYGTAPQVTADHRTGQVAADLELLTDVYITTNAPTPDQRGQICPQCSATAPGETGLCTGGQDAGMTCRAEATALVPGSAGAPDYVLSSSCRPLGSPVGTWSLGVTLGTGTATLPGPLPCAGQQDDDACGEGATCDAVCTGSPCAAIIADPAGEVCRDRKGGIRQVCCSDRPDRPCHPTAGGGALVRSGYAAPLVPDAPDVPFPATSAPVLTSTFCLPSANNSVANLVLGTPGPAAVILPVRARWMP